MPDLAALAALERTGAGAVTAPGDGPYDFVSRYFAPAKGIDEDPATGGAHCALVPFWAARTGRTSFRAQQASRRGAELACRLVGDRVVLGGVVRAVPRGPHRGLEARFARRPSGGGQGASTRSRDCRHG